MRMICPQCQSRNLEFVYDKFDKDYHIVKEGKFELSAKDALRFIGDDDYRYEMTCRDCGYSGYARTFKREYIRKDF